MLAAQCSTSEAARVGIRKRAREILLRAGSRESVSTTDEDSEMTDMDETDSDEDPIMTLDEFLAGAPNENTNESMGHSQIEQRLRDRCRGTHMQMIGALAKVLEHLSIGDNGGPVTSFSSSSIPPIGIHDYLARLHHYSRCSDACLVLTLIFIDRLLKMQPWLKLCRTNVHRLIATSLVIATKVHDDIHYANTWYARVVGMQCRELDLLEAQFLRFVGWRVHVSAEEFEQYLLTVVFPVV